MPNICYDGIVSNEPSTTLGSWLLRKLLQRELDEGRRYTMDEYAKLLEISRPYLTMLISGRKKRVSQQKAHRIAQLLRDYEILDILGYTRPDASTSMSELPPEIRETFLAGWREARSELVKRGMTTDSPEALEIIKTAFAKFGVEIKVIKK